MTNPFRTKKGRGLSKKTLKRQVAAGTCRRILKQGEPDGTIRDFINFSGGYGYGEFGGYYPHISEEEWAEFAKMVLRCLKRAPVSSWKKPGARWLIKRGRW